MKELIEIFRMSEVSAETRCRLLIKMGELINCTFGANVTEPLVYELINILSPEHKILTDKSFLRRAREKPELVSEGEKR